MAATAVIAVCGLPGTAEARWRGGWCYGGWGWGGFGCFAPGFAIGFGAPFIVLHGGPVATAPYAAARWSTAGPSGLVMDSRLLFCDSCGRPRGRPCRVSALWRHVIDDKHPDHDAD